MRLDAELRAPRPVRAVAVPGDLLVEEVIDEARVLAGQNDISHRSIGRHVRRGMAQFRDQFSDSYKLDARTGFVVNKRTGAVLPVSKVNTYMCVNPHLYLPRIGSLCRGVSKEELVDLIKQNTKNVEYRPVEWDKLHKMCESTMRWGERRPGCLRHLLTDLMNRMQTYMQCLPRLRVSYDVLCGATGILCTEGALAGHCDHVIDFHGGKMCINYQVRDPNEPVWYSSCPSLTARIFHSIVGLNATMGIAVSDAGFKFIWNHQNVFSIWPDSDEFWVATPRTVGVIATLLYHLIKMLTSI